MIERGCGRTHWRRRRKISIEIRRARVAIVAIALAIGALAYANAQSSVAGPTAFGDQGVVLQRSSQADEVEARITRTNLTGKLEAALGTAFGGVWFEPATAQVHVGVTSPQSRRNAEAVAVQTGLATHVIEVPVRWTWAQLEAAQDRWDSRLIDLLRQGRVTTSLAPDRNSVQVELASSVPAAKRAKLEREAAAESVDVSIEATPYPRFVVSPTDKQCNKFQAGLAFCNPTIVSGVTIDSEKKADGSRWTCTAGPTAILKEPAKPLDATKTFVLTAGHCIENGGGVNKLWYAYNKEGVGKGEKQLGWAGPFIYGGVDVGAIEVAFGYWTKLKDPIPVVPTVAAWSAAAETDPVPVVAQRPPMLKAKSCMSGQMSGIKCGEIIKTDQTVTYPGGKVIKDLAEVKGVSTIEGDSGAPWVSEQEFKAANPTAYVEGVHSGDNGATGNAVFQSLEKSFAELKANGIDLELLTQAKDKRHAKVKAETYPVTIDGSSTGSEKFTTEAGAIECKKSSFHGVVTEESTTLTVSPKYEECKGLFGMNATVNTEGCAYVFHMTEKVSADNYHAHMDLSCQPGKSIKFAVFTCKIEVKPQTELETVDLIDDTGASPKKDITLRPTVGGIAYTVTEDGGLCPFKGTGEKTGAEYTSTVNTTLTGQSTTEPSLKIGIEIGD